MKIVFLITTSFALLICTSTAAEQNLSHNVSWGARSSRDIHLSRQIISEKGKTLRIVSHDYEYTQKPNEFPYPRTITYIAVTDQYTNGNGGYARLTAGGPSTNFAKIHLKSQRGHGYNFIIDIYGQ